MKAEGLQNMKENRWVWQTIVRLKVEKKKYKHAVRN